MTTSFGNEFIETAIKRVLYYKSLGEKTIHQLNDDQLNDSCGPESNSIAVIIQHLSGNMLSRWTNFLTEDGEKPWRQRDDEFEIHAFNKIQLIEIWAKGWDCFIGELRSLTENDLTKTVYIRQEPLTVTDAIIRQLAHYPYHVGQMVYIGRLLKKEDWINLSIPRGQSIQYNQSDQTKDPAKNFK